MTASSKKSIDFSCGKEQFDSDFVVGRNVFADHVVCGFDIKTITVLLEPIKTLSS